MVLNACSRGKCVIEFWGCGDGVGGALYDELNELWTVTFSFGLTLNHMLYNCEYVITNLQLKMSQTK